MTKTYVVSAHGGAYRGHQFWLPLNVEVHFYVDHGYVLPDLNAYTILNKLLGNRDVHPAWVAGPDGKPCPSYSCWAYPEIGKQGGIFRRSTGRSVMSLAGTSGVKPISLQHIVDALAENRSDDGKKTVIHWLACTIESAPDGAYIQYQTPAKI